ncbi:MAG: sigma-70 family RNA polymerase sigma factor, partial [Chloroflexi bacterium]|nr:sigma-70 family RNA polymerase sigma factor [Chloroflexota bacterium]
MSDEPSLIQRAQRGDVRAYESLVQQYEQIAFRTAYLITHSADDAADAAQDAFVRAYNALHTFEQGRPFRPWLLRIVTTQALNRIQSNKRRVAMTERFTHQTLMSEQKSSPDQHLVQQQRSERLQSAVRHLSSDEQTLIALRYFLELPEAEVAEAMHIPLGTVKSRLHRTLAK